MNARAQITAGQRLSAIRMALAGLGRAIWMRGHDGRGGYVEARGEMGELILFARFEEVATAEEMEFVADAPGYVRFLLGLLDRAFAEIRRLQALLDGAPASAERPEQPARDYAAQAAMACGSAAFQIFLREQHGLEGAPDKDRAAQKVRSLCGVTSRAEFNDGGHAAAAWRALHAAFEAWKRAGR